MKRYALEVDSYATKEQRTRGIFEAVLALGMVYFIQLNIRYVRRNLLEESAAQRWQPMGRVVAYPQGSAAPRSKTGPLLLYKTWLAVVSVPNLPRKPLDDGRSRGLYRACLHSPCPSAIPLTNSCVLAQTLRLLGWRQCFFTSCIIRIIFHTDKTRVQLKYSNSRYVELSNLAFLYNSMFRVEALDILPEPLPAPCSYCPRHKRGLVSPHPC